MIIQKFKLLFFCDISQLILSHFKPGIYNKKNKHTAYRTFNYKLCKTIVRI